MTRKAKKDFTALRRELIALGYDESVISDQALRQSLDSALKRAKDRHDRYAMEMRRISRAQFEAFLASEISVEDGGVIFQGQKFWGTEHVLEGLFKIVENRFAVSVEVAQDAMERDEDLVSAWTDRMHDAFARNVLQDVKNLMNGSRELLLRIDRDELVEELTTATDEMIARSVQEG